ncbi:putative transcription factor interactor and regulator CCHC(Zn) family [Senna tora]|uniref:Putative transcription factor interactor and regulator CCHC(Zn) family n=1 Tax=Senna tora TaxID=362788 RepID=A0A835C8B4_9FABA|nr:putative transcription factor interactor and regulator CCHC(Zn) family [Senna tora]
MVFPFSSFLHHVKPKIIVHILPTFTLTWLHLQRFRGGIKDLNRLPTRPWPSSPVVVDGRSPLLVVIENMDDNGNIDDNIDGTNEYDISEPPHEQLYTDSDPENDVNKYGIELGYWNGGEESERSVGIDKGESSDSGSDVEKPEILNTTKNVKGKKFEYDDYGKIHLKCSLFFVDVNEFRNVLRDYVIQENFDIIRVKNEKARVTTICASDGCPWRIHASPGQIAGNS